MEKLLRSRLRPISEGENGGLPLRLYPEDEDLLEDAITENQQALSAAEVHSNILTATMDAFASIISPQQPQHSDEVPDRGDRSACHSHVGRHLFWHERGSPSAGTPLRLLDRGSHSGAGQRGGVLAAVGAGACFRTPELGCQKSSGGTSQRCRLVGCIWVAI